MANHTPNLTPADDSTDWEAVARYFAGESTPDEMEVVRRWLEAHPAEASALSSLSSAAAQLTNATPPDLDVEAALKRVTARRDAADVIPIGSRRTPTRTPSRTVAPARRWQPFAMPAAAAAVLLVAAGLFWHSKQNGGYTNPSGAAAQTFATTVGQRDSVRLSDGTRVVLAPQSQLIVAAGYGNTVREVELKGEAYFDVHHDAARPFLVRAGDADIRDLGTTFTVRATGEQGVRLAVTSGSVSLASQAAQDNAVVLRPGDAATLASNGQTLVERGGAVEPDTAWTRGRLVFREAPVGTVRTELRRWYGIDLQIDSSFDERHLSMTFDGESADRVLEVIALSLGAEVTKQGNVAVIKPGSARSR
jgi:transmembrane sensor